MTEAPGRIPVGYWRDSAAVQAGFHETADLPDPHTLVDVAWAKTPEAATVARYLESAPPLASFKGWSTCRICGKRNGSACRGDDVYAWPEGFAHYVREHGVRPPLDFLAHVRSRAPRTGALEVLPTFTPSTKPPANSPLSSPVVRRSLLIIGGSVIGLGVVSYAGYRWWRSKRA